MTPTAQFCRLCHTPGRQTIGLGVVLALLLGATSARGQEALLDRPIGADHLGPAVVWAPGAIAQGLWARRVAQGARVPVVFEGAAPMPSAGLPERVDLTGLTVRAALDALVARDPRYTWQQVGAAVVVRPTPAWDEASHPLHRLAGEETVGEQPLADALRAVVEGDAPSADVSALAAQVDGGRHVTRTEGPRPTVLARVAALAAEGELFVLVRDPRVTPGPYLDVARWDGRSYPIESSAAATIAEETAQ